MPDPSVRQDVEKEEIVETITVVNKRVAGYDAEFWHKSYQMVTTAILKHLPDLVSDDDVAEEVIFMAAIGKAGAELSSIRSRLVEAEIRTKALEEQLARVGGQPSSNVALPQGSNEVIRGA